MRYRVKVGKHVHDDGLVYGSGEEAGNVVESHLDLVKLFPEKFERVEGRGRSASETSEEDAPPDTTALVGTTVKDTPQTQKSGGQAVESSPRAAKAGFAAKKVSPVRDEGIFEDEDEPPSRRTPKRKSAARKSTDDDDDPGE